MEFIFIFFQWYFIIVSININFLQPLVVGLYAIEEKARILIFDGNSGRISEEL